MLSLDDCRKILGKPELTDEQVIEIRDSLYAFAHAFIDEYLREKRAGRLAGRGQVGIELYSGA